MKNVESYGAVPLRETDKGWEVLIVKHVSGYWGFPKGHKEPHEKTLDTVKRELKEETGLEVEEFLTMRPYVEHYEYQANGDRFNKYAWYYPARVKGEIALLQPEEVTEAKWVFLKESPAHLTYIQAKIVALDTIRDFDS